MTNDRTEVIEQILRLFAERGDSGYGGEAVSQREHALQAAHFAREAGASPALITAALLHDIGHLLHDLPEDAPDRGVDDHHEASASHWLGRWFGAEVVDPVRLHVAAKRYLCTIEPPYLERLSQSSRVSLELQGGPMSGHEAAAFAALPRSDAAVLLRRWDDAAKVPGMNVPAVEDYVATIEEALTKGSTAE